jgi:hypothetical protein
VERDEVLTPAPQAVRSARIRPRLHSRQFPDFSPHHGRIHRSLRRRQANCCALQLGSLHALRGIEGGIENTNYFVTSDAGEFVLTLFERLTAEQLPFYLHLMKHLAHAGIPVPDPQADAQGDILHTVCGKPAAVVNRLRAEPAGPQAVHCAAVGDMLARMHLAGRDYERQQPNLRGLPWWNETVPVVLPHMDAEQAALLRAELAYQNHVAAAQPTPPAARPGARRPVPRQRDVRGRTADGLLRLLLCRCGHLAVRPGRVPERLVHRPAHGPPRRAARRALLDAYQAVRR